MRPPVQRRLQLTRADGLSVGQPSVNSYMPVLSRSDRMTQWKQSRVDTIREIHGRPCAQFCRTADALFTHYAEVASPAQPEHSRQAQVADFLMSLAGRALFRGHRIALSRKVKLMQELHDRVLTEVEEARSTALPPRVSVPTMAVTPSDPSFAPLTGAAVPGPAPAGSAAAPICIPDDDTTPAQLLANSTTAAQQQPASRAEELLAAVRKAAFVVAQGGPHHIQRAARSLSAAPLAPLNAHTIRCLRDLHPAGVAPVSALPDRAIGISDIDPARLDSILRRRVHNGSAPGLSGWTGSHLLAVWERATAEGRLGFQLLIRDICNGVFDGEVKRRLLACVLVPLAKKDNGVRPVAVAEVFVRCAAHYMMSLIEEAMPTFFPRIQFGVKHPGGSETAAQLTRAELAYAATKHSDVIALKTDFKNAFNAISRAKVWEALLAQPRAEPILKAFHWQYGDASPLLVYERGELFAELRSSNGVRQGCPFAAFAFALTVQPLYEAALRQTVGCNGFSIQDDFTLVGPAAQVLQAYDYIKSHAQTELGLELVTSKCQVYVPCSTAAQVATDIHALCAARNLPHANSMESLGVMFGSEASVVAHCDSAVDDSARFFECVSHPAMPKQTAALLLRYCALPRLGYMARTAHPDQLAGPAARFDDMAQRAQLAVLQLDNASLSALQPRTSDPDSRVHDPGEGDPPPGSQPPLSTDRMSQASREQLLERIALPLSLGGLGVRPVMRTRHAAYFSSLMQILPEFARLHPELRDAACFRRTQLYQEMQQCREALRDAGAAEQFSPLSGSEPAAEPILAPAAAAATPSVAAASSHTPAAVTTPYSAPPSVFSTRFPSPSFALLQSIDDIWQQAARGTSDAAASSPSARKLQHALTRSMEASAWMRLFNSCSRYQQTILTSLTLNPGCSAWLSTTPLTSDAGYRLRDEEYLLAVRHRLGLLPYDDLRDALCVSCAQRNRETPALLIDPDHMHSCVLQQGASVKRRHDALKLVLAELARSCGYHVEIEPPFPAQVQRGLNPQTGEQTHSVHSTQIRGDLLLVRHNTRELIDVTVVRPTSLTGLQRAGPDGPHMQPLVAACSAETGKHRTYDAECARHGWKMVPFALESYGAKGKEAAQLLQRMSAHSLDRSPADFLAHADRVLSVALQVGNAGVSSAGTAELHLQAYSRGGGADRPQGTAAADRRHASPAAGGSRQQARAQREQHEIQLLNARGAGTSTAGLGRFVHTQYHAARIGVHGGGA